MRDGGQFKFLGLTVRVFDIMDSDASVWLIYDSGRWCNMLVGLIRVKSNMRVIYSP